MSIIDSLGADCFDIEGAKKQYEEIKSKCDFSTSFSPEDIAAEAGDPTLVSLIRGNQFTPIKDVVDNIVDPDARGKITAAIQSLRKKQIEQKQQKSTPTKKLMAPNITRQTKAVASLGDAGGDIKSLFGGKLELPDLSLSSVQSAIESGVMTAEKFVSDLQSSFAQAVGGGGGQHVNLKLSDGKRENYKYGDPTLKPKLEERDEQYVPFMTTSKTGLYINEKTKEDPNSFYIIYKGKQTAIRINKEGIHISTDNGYNARISMNRNLVIDGGSCIGVKGGNYDVYVDGKVNIYSTKDMNLTSEKDINLTAKGSINFEANKDFTVQAHKDITMRADSKFMAHSNGKMSFDTNDEFHTKAMQSIYMNTGLRWNLLAFDIVAIDGLTTLIQCGAAEEASPDVPPSVPINTANPLVQVIPKI